jgi:hypothetical protein
MVTQLRFARSEFMRGINGVTEEEGLRRLMPMNSIGWMVGHLALQEHYLWVLKAQGQNLSPDLHLRVGTGRPASTPPLSEMLEIWRTVTSAADRYLDTITAETLDLHPDEIGGPMRECVGTSIVRNTFHYWFHLGEALAIRQMLGHTGLPEFVGPMDKVRYRD